MTPDTVTSFLTYYLRSLSERTRKEKNGAQYGIDWILYNLGLALEWSPVRMPWIRTGPGELSKTKTEPEFGVDLSFLKDNRETLVIFVIKDEVLSYRNWTAHSFDSDLRRAAMPDLTGAGLEQVKRVIVTLAYNKDDDNGGIRCFEQATRVLGTKIADGIELCFERWNLTNLTEQVRSHLITPSLVPQNFYGHFNYICAQVGDFIHGSDEWVNQLVPNWRRFLNCLVGQPIEERLLRLIPVTLVIIRSHGANASSGTGWLDLVEWAMLAVWDAAQKSTKDLTSIVHQMWVHLYVEELERFYAANASVLGTEHGLETRRTGTALTPLNAIANSFVGFWHLGRIGLLSMAWEERMDAFDEKNKPEVLKRLHTSVAWMSALIKANPSTRRPILDIQHIELFLAWRALWTTGQSDEVALWLIDLQQRLMMRRFFKNTSIPFISGVNAWELAFERVADEPHANYFGDYSSYLLLMIIEMCCGVSADKRANLLREYYQGLALGIASNGTAINGHRAIDLLGWTPPSDWKTRILSEPVREGVTIFVNFEIHEDQPDAGIAAQVNRFVEASQAVSTDCFGTCVPPSVLVLAAIKHQTALPPEFWRKLIFDSTDTSVGYEP